MPPRRYARRGQHSRVLLWCVIFLCVLAVSPGSLARAPSIYAAPPTARVAVAPTATTLVVTTTADVVDGDTSSFSSLNAQPGPDGAIALREAMLAANTTPISSTAAITIAFAIPTSDPGYDAGSKTWTIRLGAAALPELARGQVTIDGTTQPGSGKHPPIVLDGFNVNEPPGLNNGLTITSGHNTVRGLTLMNFWDTGLVISGSAATNNLVAGCYIGVDARGASAQGNGTGIDIRDGAADNLIGGAARAARNVISSNAYNSGVVIQGTATARNTIAGNFIGVDASGHVALGNTFAGIFIRYGAHDNLIGGAGQGNLISGNDWGLYIDNGIGNTIAGNIIGLAVDGQTPLGNRDGGIAIFGGAHDNLIGGTDPATRNVISGNGHSSSSYGQGIYIADPDTSNNTIQGNYIGTDASGLGPGGNYRQGILIAYGAHNTLIGGTQPGAGNVITYNGLGGIRVDSPANQIVGNLIGVGADGVQALGNQYNGVRIFGDNNIVGPNNLIANNQLSGIMVSGANTLVVQNILRANARSGLCVAGPATRVLSNTITTNGGYRGEFPDCDIQGGVVITGTGDTQVTSNTILDNIGAGITVRSGRDNSILGNSISGNSTVGIQLVYGGNGEIAPPVINRVGANEVAGTSCANCHVEVFADQRNQGRYFLGTTTAAIDGSFQLPLDIDTLQAPHLTATHTDPQGNTSPFAAAVTVPSAPDPNPNSGRTTIYIPIVAR